MVFNTDEIVKRALDSDTNVPGTCQLWTRTIIGVDSAGDQDGDGDADAVDGWKSEPVRFRHRGDRKVPAGMPAFFEGGSNGFGHRCIGLGKKHGWKLRSTDMSGSSYSPGHVGTCTIEDIERSMGLTYVGWSETMSGVVIPKAPPPTIGEKLEHALDDVQAAKSRKGTRRRAVIDRVKKLLRSLRKR